jgi:transcriptional regulator GlxA family with amidase domain
MSFLTPSTEALEIDLLILPGSTLMLTAAVVEPLRAANRIAGQELYRWRMFSPGGAPIENKSRIPVPVDGPFVPARETNPLFVLSSYDWRQNATSALKMALSKSARYRSAIFGIESGSWLLAEASLLDRHSVAVHWEDREEFEAAYPEISIVPQRYVIDGNRITSGGPLPTLDLMIEIVRQRHGYSLALEVSRLFVYERESAGALLHAPLLGGARTADERVSQAVRLMEDTIDTPLSLARLARRVGVSARHLRQRFRQTMDVTPHEHYLALRLNAARRKVIETNVAFADIAEITGFNSSPAFSRSYRARYGESPTQTRRRISPKP